MPKSTNMRWSRCCNWQISISFLFVSDKLVHTISWSMDWIIPTARITLRLRHTQCQLRIGRNGIDCKRLASYLAVARSRLPDWRGRSQRSGLIIKVVMSKILVFVSNQQDYQDDRSGSTMILLFADKSLITAPGAKPEMYLVKPTMFHQQTFSNYRPWSEYHDLWLVQIPQAPADPRVNSWVKGGADSMIQLHAYYMVVTLTYKKWTEALWNRSSYYLHNLL